MEPNCERWMWIELIGFDHAEPDYHVAAFLDNCGFVPVGLSILFCCPDFVHLHDGLEREVAFPPDYCSYAGKAYNVERRRQVWTNHQLRGLVQELQRHGIQVYFSIMNIFVSQIDGAPYRSPWCDAHPELMEFTRDGQSAGCLNPLRRFRDGTYYEDFLVERLVAVARDYGFDGFHAADGYSSPRQPIWNADYSDDMVAQFTALLAVEVPSDLTVTARADHIWQHLRRPWCEFYARRFGQLFTKICGALHAAGRQVAFNNAWTRDPFEAYDRYGVDYRRIAAAGVDRFFLETVAAGVSIGAESGFRGDLRSNLQVMLAYLKLDVPDMPLVCLNCTGDSTENWDVLNHAPPVSEREILSLGQMFVQTATGLHRASSGPLVCLADGINQPQWAWLNDNWRAAYNTTPRRTLGATVVWSATALDAEIDDYPTTRVVSRQTIAAELHLRGAPLHVVVETADVASAPGCLLLPRPELLSAAELAEVLAAAHGPVMTIGRQAADLPPADFSFAEGPAPDHLVCRVYHAGRSLQPPSLEPAPPAELPAAFPDPPNYLHDLWFRPVSDAFLHACASLLTDLSEMPRLVGEVPDLRLVAYETTAGRIRLLVGNEAHFYVLARIDAGRELERVDIASHFPGRTIYPDGRYLDVRVPPRGMVALDLVGSV